VLDIWHPAQQAGIDIRLNIHAQQVKRTGQQLLLSLLVRNLLDNAIRYSPRGSVVDVTLDARSFTVRDNGPAFHPRRWRASASAFIVRRVRMPRAAGWGYLLSGALPPCTGCASR
jgi:K+-sensing histidine kinase KdpD